MNSKRTSSAEERVDENELEGVSYSRNLPTDLIHQILYRCRFTFITRCKVVCTAWNNLLTSPYFLYHYAKNTPFTTLVLSEWQQKREVFSLLEISGNGCTRTPIEPKVPGWDKRNLHLEMVGSCNGLLCLLLCNSSIHVIYIYNPISGETVLLPNDRWIKNAGHTVSYKFGFCASANKFKVLKIVDLIHPRQNMRTTQRYEIFTVGVDDRWRVLANPVNPKFVVRSVAINGTVYMFVSENTEIYADIIAFYVGEEKFGRISHPPGLVLNYVKIGLAVLNNHLCLYDYSSSSQYTLWTMEECGDAHTWTKMIVLRKSSLLHHPVATLPNGNILFQLAKKGLMSYSPNQEEFTLIYRLGGEGFINYAREFSPFCSSTKEVAVGAHTIA